MKGRKKALRRAWRTFWWMVVKRKGYEPTLSRRVYIGIVWRETICGIMTGEEHSWKPMPPIEDPTKARAADCRWCGSCVITAEESNRADAALSPEEKARREANLARFREQWEAMKREDHEKLRADAIEHLKREGYMRDGKILWS